MHSNALNAAMAVGLSILWMQDATAQTQIQPHIQAQVRAPRAADPQRGRQIAEQLCSGCHRVTHEQALLGGWADVPSFPEIANLPGRTTERLVGSIMFPHPPMPDIALATGTLHDVAAYILTFKKD